MDLFEAILWLTLNIYHEARSESVGGQKAVAHVVFNRVKNRNLSVKEVVQQPKQFSWIHLKKKYTPNEWGAFVECIKIVLEVIDEPDFTGGATHYHLGTVYPKWAPKMTYLGKYGSHLFYKKGPVLIIHIKKQKTKLLKSNL